VNPEPLSQPLPFLLIYSNVLITAGLSAPFRGRCLPGLPTGGDSRMFYEDVFRMLQESDVRYAVAGGVALVLHGVVRLTADLDLIVDLDRENLKRFIQAMKKLGYGPRVPARAEDFADPATRAAWKREKNMEVFSFINQSKPMALIDVFIDEKIPFEAINRDMVRVKAKGITIPVVSISHLKMLKKAAGRPQDIADIEAIESLENMEKEKG
jgi:hypothetical protein